MYERGRLATCGPPSLLGNQAGYYYYAKLQCDTNRRHDVEDPPRLELDNTYVKE